ncbi:hypothetical protein GCM10017044_25060 [Kordiimonas sediminis]|uniref:Uncharacterized protein n=1 Tax=Kordiimonas sediminis TaxID=1735581 RepID=A0A919AXY1_9PROT|nr:hypothetical protein GCM10017044_25060 [Kordiimonas sediminis]
MAFTSRKDISLILTSRTFICFIFLPQKVSVLSFWGPYDDCDDDDQNTIDKRTTRNTASSAASKHQSCELSGN